MVLEVPTAALRLWRSLAGDAEVLRPMSRRVVRGSRGLCPHGWVGVVRLGDAYAIEAGEADDRTLARLLELTDPADAGQVAEALRIRDQLGPGELAYLPDGVAPAPFDLPPGLSLDERPVAGLLRWFDTLPPEDLAESSLPDLDHALVASRDGRPVGAVGHLDWPAGVAHLGIVVAPEERGRGTGRLLAAAGAGRAVAEGRSPQWRAATDNHPSRAAARAAGLVEVGRQFSFVPA